MEELIIRIDILFCTVIYCNLLLALPAPWGHPSLDPLPFGPPVLEPYLHLQGREGVTSEPDDSGAGHLTVKTILVRYESEWTEAGSTDRSGGQEQGSSSPEPLTAADYALSDSSRLNCNMGHDAFLGIFVFIQKICW